MDFKKFIGENHPDPDTLLLNNFEQMCILAEKYAKTLQLRKTDVSKRFRCWDCKSFYIGVDNTYNCVTHKNNCDITHPREQGCDDFEDDDLDDEYELLLLELEDFDDRL